MSMAMFNNSVEIPEGKPTFSHGFPIFVNVEAASRMIFFPVLSIQETDPAIEPVLLKQPLGCPIFGPLGVHGRFCVVFSL